MVLIAVIVGYILGVAPFIAPKILEIKNSQKQEKQKAKEDMTQEQLLDEWLNGEKQEILERTEVNQEDILKEYLSGIVTKGE